MFRIFFLVFNFDIIKLSNYSDRPSVRHFSTGPGGVGSNARLVKAWLLAQVNILVGGGVLFMFFLVLLGCTSYALLVVFLPLANLYFIGILVALATAVVGLFVGDSVYCVEPRLAVAVGSSFVLGALVVAGAYQLPPVYPAPPVINVPAAIQASGVPGSINPQLAERVVEAVISRLNNPETTDQERSSITTGILDRTLGSLTPPVGGSGDIPRIFESRGLINVNIGASDVNVKRSTDVHWGNRLQCSDQIPNSTRLQNEFLALSARYPNRTCRDLKALAAFNVSEGWDRKFVRSNSTRPVFSANVDGGVGVDLGRTAETISSLGDSSQFSVGSGVNQSASVGSVKSGSVDSTQSALTLYSNSINNGFKVDPEMVIIKNNMSKYLYDKARSR